MTCSEALLKVLPWSLFKGDTVDNAEHVSNRESSNKSKWFTKVSGLHTYLWKPPNEDRSWSSVRGAMEIRALSWRLETLFWMTFQHWRPGPSHCVPDRFTFILKQVLLFFFLLPTHIGDPRKAVLFLLWAVLWSLIHLSVAISYEFHLPPSSHFFFFLPVENPLLISCPWQPSLIIRPSIPPETTLPSFTAIAWRRGARFEQWNVRYGDKTHKSMFEISHMPFSCLPQWPRPGYRGWHLSQPGSLSGCEKQRPQANPQWAWSVSK